ncbi:hypothetical protein EX30DRAFT_389291 [Ascodesmis nigricans]|uniref:Fungal-type protein kinase domain-containing protein n=1 Tax=Ascodesmis nigricans TaxID=341454 RepID=A0A4S2MJ80_9PEZI|nr:hypothetical protein EX30DRAFT_389291 [Ascodesmis nigricans]
MLNHEILHRDVSVINIMISSSSTGGYLIDLDFVVLLSRQSASSAPHRTGMSEFIGINVPEGPASRPRELFLRSHLDVHTLPGPSRRLIRTTRVHQPCQLVVHGLIQ